MKRLLRATGRDQDWQWISLTKELDRSVDVRPVHETSHAQLKLIEAFAVGAQRSAAIGAECHVSVVAGHQYALRNFVKVENVDRLTCRRDGFRGIKLWKALSIDSAGHVQSRT